jgi:DNA-binding SARP family transcriptional activator
MPHLTTFGGLSVETDRAPVVGAAQQRKRLALLALLAAAGRRGTSRDKLIAYLWPDSDAEHGRNLLKQACFALRRDLRAPNLFLGTLELRLNPEIITSDIQRFEDALARGDPAEAVACYAGPFLDGFYLGEAGDFGAWVETERAQWTKRVCEVVESLATEAGAAGNLRGSVRWWRRLTELDRVSSHAASGLMRALVAMGDAAAALEFGRMHERVVRDALGAAPDATVTDLLARLGAPSAEPLTGAGSPVAPVPARLTPVSPGASLGKRLALGVVTVVLVGVVFARSRRPVSLDPALVAVAPFELLDSNLGPSRERLVNGLSRNLDGLGPYRTLSPTIIARRWDGRSDRLTAARLGRSLGTGIVLFGQLSRVPPDSLRLRVAALDARRDQILAEIDRTAAGDIDRLADSLTLDVIRALGPAAAGVPLRVLSTRARSLAALKAFIQGERYTRRYALDSAITSYDRAIALDTTFAVALRAAGRARGWNLQPAPLYAVWATTFNHGLSARDSLLIAADSQGSDPIPFHRYVGHKFAVLEDATRRYPEDAEVWFELGDLRFHNGFSVWWNTWNDARAAFDRAIALDSAFAAAYIHPVEIALNDNDPAAALRYVRGYLSIPFVHADGGGMRLLSLLLDGRRDEFDRELARADFVALRRLAFAIRTWPDSTEAQLRVARRLLAAAEATTPGGSPAGEYNLRQYRSLLAQALIFRGHLHEARDVVGGRFVMSAFMELAHLGALHGEVVEAAVARWLQYPYHPDYQGDHVLFPWLTEGPCYRTMDVAWWWAARRDTVQLRRLVRHEDSTARALASASVAPWARPVPRFARAALAMARGDTAGVALTSLWLPPDSICDSRPHVQALFQVLVAIGREQEATTVFDWRHDRWVPWVLARARLAERLGDRRTAIHYYEFVRQAWLHADPELQPVVAEARSALARLGGDPP